jgi:hypothetical protein
MRATRWDGRVGCRWVTARAVCARALSVRARATERGADGPGCVLRSTLAGQHMWPTSTVASSPPVLRELGRRPRMGLSARTPNHLPQAPKATPSEVSPRGCAVGSEAARHPRCTGRWWCPRAQAPFAVAPHVAGAPEVMTPLSVVGRGGAPRARAGARGYRRRPAARTWAWRPITRATIVRRRHACFARPQTKSHRSRAIAARAMEPLR